MITYVAKHSFPPLIILIVALIVMGMGAYIVYASIFVLDVSIDEAAFVFIGDCIALILLGCILVRILSLFPIKVIVLEDQIEFHGYLKCVVRAKTIDLIVNEHSYKDNDWYIDMKIGWRRVCISHTDFPVELKNYIQHNTNCRL